MRHCSLLLFIVLSMAGISQAQIGDVSTTIRPILPGNYGSSISVLDHDGNLFVMDITYSLPLAAPGQPVTLRVPPTAKTRVTVITNSGTKLASRDYEGSLQVIGVGRNAVYAMVNTYSLNTSTATERSPSSSGVGGAVFGFTTARRLVSLKPGVGGLPTTLPGIDIPIRAEAKLSAAGIAGGLDTIALVDAAPMLLLPAGVTPVPVEQRNVRLYKSDGNAFMPVTPNPIPLP